MGIASAVVQKPDLSRRTSGPTAGIVIGLVCTAVVWTLAWPIAACSGTPTCPDPARPELSFVFMGWSMTGVGLLRRELRSRRCR
jgi:hypothetical protein